MGPSENKGSSRLENWDKWLQAGTIPQQVGKVFNLFAVLVLLLGVVATVGALRIEQRSSVLADLTETSILSANITRSVSLAKDDLGKYRADGYQDEILEGAVQHARDAIAKNQELRLAAGAVDEAYLPRIAAIDEGINSIITIFGEVRDAPRDLVEQESFLGPRYDAIDTTLIQIGELREDVSARAKEESGSELFEIQILIGAFLVCLLASLALIFIGKRLVAKRIVDPIAQISDASGRIADGDTSLELPHADREDEIGTLATALNILRDKQQAAADKALQESERELERQRELETEREAQRKAQRDLLQALADKFEHSVGEVASEVASASDLMHAAATELAGTVDGSSQTVSQANDRLKQASTGITGAATATDEFALSINEVSRQATFSSERARKASDAASKADQTVTDLTGSAEKISSIIEVIAGIAQRTNLLALNASIEAARGGEAGRGFAVVASEVKELAIQTGRATEEVETLIRDMQDATADSASMLGLIAEEVIALETTAISIASSVDQQSVAGQDLARSIDTAAQNTQTVSATIDDVSRVVEASGAAASEMLYSSEGLTEQASNLREQVSDFLRQVRAA